MTPAEREMNLSYYADYGQRYDVLRKYSTDYEPPHGNLFAGLVIATVVSGVIWATIIWAGRVAYAYWSATR